MSVEWAKAGLASLMPSTMAATPPAIPPEVMRRNERRFIRRARRAVVSWNFSSRSVCFNESLLSACSVDAAAGAGERRQPDHALAAVDQALPYDHAAFVDGERERRGFDVEGVADLLCGHEHRSFDLHAIR